MSLGLVLLLAEALTVYGLVFAFHALRDRITLLPYFGLLGILAATMRWTTDAGLVYAWGPLTFIVGSVVFLTALLFGVFLLYLFDGVKAAQLGIYTVVGVSILSPAIAWLFKFQLAQIDVDAADRIMLSSARIYAASTAALIFDFLFIAMLWEFFSRHLARTPLLVRVAVCLLSTFWLDTVLFSTGAFWGDPALESILKGNLLSRFVLTMLVSPLLAGYILWEKRRQRREFTPRALMAILYQSARQELDLRMAHRELEERRRIEEALRRRDAILGSLAFAAEHAVRPRGEATGMGEILRSLGMAAGVDRAYISENDVNEDGQRILRQRDAWIARSMIGKPGSEPWNVAVYAETGLARWEEHLAAGEALTVDVRNLPPEEQVPLRARGVESYLVLPIFVDDEWWGLIGFEACGQPRTWPRSVIDALRAAAGTLGAALRRARIEEELRDSQERLELALHGGDLGLWDWDLAEDQVVFNERWAQMLGYSLSEIEPSSHAWERLIHPDDMPRVRTAMAAHLKGETSSYEFELRMRARDGSWRWILSKGRVVSRGADGRALRAAGTQLDITRLKETEEALRLSQEMFRLMYEESPLGLALCEMDGTLVQANRAYLKITGYTEEEIRKLTYFDITPRTYEAEEIKQLESMHSTGRYGPYEKEYTRKDGGRVPVLLNGCRVTGTDGRQFIWSIVEDISIRKAADKVIADARRYQREIETRIEETLLRGRPPEGIEGVDLAAVNVPTEHMDGDFADFVCLNSQCFDVLVGDVMGKGILAALVSAGAKSHFLRALSTHLAAAGGGDYPRPVALVRSVHERITRQLIDLDCFLTLCYARFDLQAGRVTYVDCGHTKTIRFRMPDHDCTFLEGDNVPIGFLESETYEQRSTDLRPGDIFFFYSDGLTETRSLEGNLFGVDRLIDALKLHGSLDAEALTDKVIDTVRAFAGSDEGTDDQTCVAVKILDANHPADGALAQLKIDASTEELVAARTFLRNYLHQYEAILGDPDDFGRVVLAFVEALSNIIKHSCPGAADQTIVIELRSSRRRLGIVIRHGGRPFRPQSTPLPDPVQRRESGYGLYIMNRCFTHIGYETLADGSQSVTLVKHFDGAPDPATPSEPGVAGTGGTAGPSA